MPTLPPTTSSPSSSQTPNQSGEQGAKNPPLSRPKKGWHLVAWALVWCTLGLGVALMLPVIEEAMGLSIVRYRRYRSRRASRYKGPRSKFVVKVSKLSLAGRIDREKLRQAIKQKLKRVARCYEMLSRPAKKPSARVALRRRYRARRTRRKPPKKKRKKRKRTDKKVLGTALVSMELNAYGRASSTQLRKSSLPKRYHHCFVWFFRGRKFFPPQGNRSMKLRMALRLERRPPSSKKKKRSRILRKGGGKW